MRIDLNANLVGASENPGRAQKSSSRSPSPTSGKGGAAELEQASSDQLRLRSLESRVNGMPEVRQEKVEALGKVVRKGSYEPPPEKTAEAMMAAMTAGRALR